MTELEVYPFEFVVRPIWVTRGKFLGYFHFVSRCDRI